MITRVPMYNDRGELVGYAEIVGGGSGGCPEP